MKNAEVAVKDILTAFENPTGLPEPLAQVFVHRKDCVPCRKWSWRNQLIVAIRGYSEARGFRQWESAGRYVKKGERAFRILSPVIHKDLDEETGEEETVVVGYKGTPVFGYEQTQGEQLPPRDRSTEDWIASLPLVEVARSWDLSVQTYNGQGASRLGSYRHGNAIALGVHNLSTWAHELVHAADHRNGNMKELGRHWRSEIVAELGGATLLHILGMEHEADLGGCWEYVNRYARQRRLKVIDACGKVIDRTCEAVALILDTAERLKAGHVKDVAVPC